jgi:steroid 5-alpha reductase family enzyme
VVGWGIVAIAMLTLWIRQLRTRNATSVDVAWSAGLGFLALFYPWYAVGDPVRLMVVALLAAVWAARLAVHLLRDRVLGRTEEDGRYKYLRAHWGKHANVGYFFFYQAQAVFALIFSIPIFAAMQGGPLGPMAWAGVAVWLLAVAGETIADQQLARFRANPANRGRVCEEGLWRHSRHPNYFFEWLHWWAHVLIGGGATLTWIGPVAMLLFLFRLTGIPHTEAQSLRSRGEAYRAYQRSTSIFIPWFRKPA